MCSPDGSKCLQKIPKVTCNEYPYGSDLNIRTHLDLPPDENIGSLLRELLHSVALAVVDQMHCMSLALLDEEINLQAEPLRNEI